MGDKNPKKAPKKKADKKASVQAAPATDSVKNTK
jgi:hypothetical protein